MHSDQKDFGRIALVGAIVAIVTPFGGWLTIIVAFLASLAYGEGLLLGVSSIAVNMVHLIFFSARLWNAEGLGQFGATGESPLVPWVLIGAQVIAVIVLLIRHKRSKSMPASSLGP